MTRTAMLLVLAIATFGVSPADAQVSGARAKDPALQAAIEARQKGIDAKNVAEWEKYSADEFVQITADGVRHSRQERMKALAANTTTPSPIIMDQVRMYGTDAAVTIQHNPGSKNQIMLFWVRQGGAWKVAAASGSPYTGK